MSPVPLRHLVSYGPGALACKQGAAAGRAALALPRRALLCLPVLLALLLAGFAPTPALAGAQETVRIVAIGDSLTAGYGLAVEEGFLPQMARWLARHGAPRTELVNMGVSGDTTAGGRARLDWALDDDTDAVILALGGNDVLRGVAPAETRRNLDAMLTALAERGLPVLLLGIEAPANYGPEYKAAFDAIFPELAEKHGALVASWELQRLAARPEMAQPDGLHPSAAGVAEIVERLGPAVLALIERARE